MFFFLLLCSICLFPQHVIETKEYTYHVFEHDSQIDFSKIIKNLQGNYKVEIIKVYNEKYEKNKEVIFEICELQIILNSDINTKPINISKCNIQ